MKTGIADTYPRLLPNPHNRNTRTNLTLQHDFPPYTAGKIPFSCKYFFGLQLRAARLAYGGCTARNCGTKKITKDSRILPRALRGFTTCTVKFLRGITAFSTRYRRISLRNITAFSTRHRHAPCEISPHPLPDIPLPLRAASDTGAADRASKPYPERTSRNRIVELRNTFVDFFPNPLRHTYTYYRYL